MDDRQIISLFFERSEQAIKALSEKYGNLLMRLSMNVLGNKEDSEECVDDTLLTVWNQIPPEEPQHLSAYTCRIARNLALTKYHSNTAAKRNSHFDLPIDELAESLAGPGTVEDSVAEKELGRLINLFLAEQKQEDRQLFVRRYWFGDGVKELSSAFSMSENRISVRLSRMRGRLREYLEKEGIEL